MDAALADTYGFVPTDPDLKFRLYLNLEPVRSRRAFDQCRAIAVALGHETMPDDWIRAVASTPDELSLWRRHEAKRSLALRPLD